VPGSATLRPAVQLSLNAAEIVEILNKAVNAGLAEKLKARLTDLGSLPLPGRPAMFGQLIAEETEKMG